MNDLVSVIITTHNRLEFLKNALSSVLNQSYNNIEVIIVDSSSNAHTQNFIKENENLIYIHSQINHPNVLRNLGVQCSNGNFIAFLDDDDTWEKSKIEKQVLCLNDNDIGLCYTGKNIINQKRLGIVLKKELLNLINMQYYGIILLESLLQS